MSGGRAAQRLGTVAMAGAPLQLVYGVLAVVWPYPLIIAPAPELVWGVVNLGMLAGIAAWLAIAVARPRWLVLMAVVWRSSGISYELRSRSGSASNRART